MDTLTELVILAGGTLALVVLDTYFWVRTTLSLRDWGQEIEPRLGLLDQLAGVLQERFGLKVGSTIPQGAVVSEVRRTKKGSPYVVINGKARFLSETQAAAITAGKPIPGVPQIPSGAMADFQAPAADVPIGPAGAGAGDLSGLDYAGMAAELGAPEAAVRAFVAKHSGGGGGAPTGVEGPAADGSAEPAMDNFLMSLVTGDLDKDKAAEAAREMLANRQRGRQPDTAMVGSGGVMWG